MTKTIERFADWSDAFDHCRECNRPILAIVGDEEAKIFPSGRFVPRNAAAKIAAYFEPDVKAATRIR